MPILEIEIITHSGETLKPGLSEKIADLAGEIFGSKPGGTWVRLRTLSSEAYAENGGGPPAGVSPVFVSILKSDLPSTVQLEKEAALLTATIAQACDRPPENVHLLYLPAASGRVVFGGRLLAG
jgi:phenylpyruvate tautomerase PptA (4-oxalocrotonate tautomerase family)